MATASVSFADMPQGLRRLPRTTKGERVDNAQEIVASKLRYP